MSLLLPNGIAPKWHGHRLGLGGRLCAGGELSKHDDPADAFAAYDRIVRPYVDQAQNIPRFVPRFGQPKTRWGIALQRIALKLAANPRLSWLSGKFLTTPARNIDLPSYGHDVRVAAPRKEDR